MSPWRPFVYPALIALIMACVWLANLLPISAKSELILQTAGLLAGLLVLWLWMREMYRRYISPMSHLSAWAERRRPLYIDSDIDIDPDFDAVLKRISLLREELTNMRDLLDDDDYRQTQTLAQKSRSLQVLYDVAASINIFNDLDDLLTRFLHTLIDVVHARSATVRLLDRDDNSMRLVASVGLDDEELVIEGRNDIQASDISSDVDITYLDEIQTSARLVKVTVPLHYHGNTLGYYSFVVEQVELESREDIRDLLTSIGRHIGIAIEKVRVDHQAQRLNIIQERNQLAHELHDSLAQTLASLRFQVRILDDSLSENKLDDARSEVQRIRNNLDEANRELRGLLAHFMAPMDARGLLPALEDLISRFRRETGIVTFFQKECQEPSLPENKELQVIRIVQEALANIRKHSQAHAVRILLRCDKDGQYHVLVEDDGIGLDTSSDKLAEQHFGLNILRERADKLDGELSIDSETGEGTRLDLSFVHRRKS